VAKARAAGSIKGNETFPRGGDLEHRRAQAQGELRRQDRTGMTTR
jgi:hypothetical protein